jgi:hypothetical protein
MRLKVLLMTASLAASPAWAQQEQPSSQRDASSAEKSGIRDQEPNDNAPLAASPSPQSTPIISIERIRAALAKPPPILAPLTGRKPDFAVHIEKRLPMADIFDTPPWATPAVGASQSGVGINVLSLIRSAKRAHDVQAARDEANREIADYCAAQPNAGAGIQICSISPGIR